MELFLTYDQLDAANSAAIERLLRRVQFIEEGYRQKLEAKKGSKDGFLSGMAEHFSGRPRMAGGVIVSSDLLKAAASGAAEMTEVIRQQRKAAEARALLGNK